MYAFKVMEIWEIKNLQAVNDWFNPFIIVKLTRFITVYQFDSHIHDHVIIHNIQKLLQNGKIVDLERSFENTFLKHVNETYQHRIQQ